MTSWLYFRKKQHTSCYTCKFRLFLKDDHLDLEPLKKAGSCYNRNQHKNQMRLKAITMPPPLPPTGHLQFFSFLEVYSPPQGTQEETIPHPQATDWPHIQFFLHLCTKAKQHIFTTFTNIFLSLLRVEG